jgi:transcriptional regulator with XRE-family HTH domain
MIHGQSTPERVAVLNMIWELQEEAGISAAQLARESGMGQMYLHRRLTGQVGFNVEDLLAVAAPLHIDPQVLLSRALHLTEDAHNHPHDHN